MKQWYIDYAAYFQRIMHSTHVITFVIFIC